MDFMYVTQVCRNNRCYRLYGNVSGWCLNELCVVCPLQTVTCISEVLLMSGCNVILDKHVCGEGGNMYLVKPDLVH